MKKYIIPSIVLVFLGFIAGISFSAKAEYKYNEILKIIESNSKTWNKIEKIQNELNYNNVVLRGLIRER